MTPQTSRSSQMRSGGDNGSWTQGLTVTLRLRGGAPVLCADRAYHNLPPEGGCEAIQPHLHGEPWKAQLLCWQTWNQHQFSFTEGWRYRSSSTVTQATKQHEHNLWVYIAWNLDSITRLATLQIRPGPINYQSVGSGSRWTCNYWLKSSRHLTDRNNLREVLNAFITKVDPAAKVQVLLLLHQT